MTPIIISHVHARGFAFGIVTETGEQVFIPPHVLDGHGLQTGSEALALTAINPNEAQRALTKFVAVKLQSASELEAATDPEIERELEVAPLETPLSISELDQITYDLICENSYITTGELSEYIKVTTQTAGNSAMRLFNAGKISKADVHAKVGQSRPSFILWAAKASDFLEG